MALIATAVVLAANVLLRPLARRIDRRPAEEATELANAPPVPGCLSGG